jgi:cytochrome P450
MANSQLLPIQNQGENFKKIKIQGKDYWVFFDYETINEIGTGKSNFFNRAITFYPIKRVVGNGIFTGDGETHLRDRRIIQQSFNKEMMEEYLEVFFADINETVLSWEDKEKINFYTIATKLVLSLVTKCVFNYDLSKYKNFSKARIALLSVTPDFNEGYLDLFDKESKKIISDMKKEKRAIKNLYEVLNEILEKAKNNSNEKDIASLLLKSNVSFSDKEIKDHLANIIVPGYRTTISLLSWSIFLISENQNVLKDLQKEADNCLWIKQNRAPTLEEIHDNYEISKKIIKETLRLYPPVWVSVKQAKEDVRLSSTFVPKGSNAVISQYIIHRNAKTFDSPEIWNPYRWTKDFEQSLPKGSYIPFGQGSRQCIGNEFAIAEVQMILLLMAKNFSWKNVKDENSFQISPSITLRPKNNIPIILEKREQR